MDRSPHPCKARTGSRLPGYASRDSATVAIDIASMRTLDVRAFAYTFGTKVWRDEYLFISLNGS
jgi:hypothetical protein